MDHLAMDWVLIAAFSGLLALLAFTLVLMVAFVRAHERTMRSIVGVVDRLRGDQEENTRSLNRLFQIVVAHDQTVRGVNSDVVGETRDILKNILPVNEEGSS